MLILSAIQSFFIWCDKFFLQKIKEIKLNSYNREDFDFLRYGRRLPLSYGEIESEAIFTCGKRLFSIVFFALFFIFVFCFLYKNNENMFGQIVFKSYFKKFIFWKKKRRRREHVFSIFSKKNKTNMFFKKVSFWNWNREAFTQPNPVNEVPFSLDQFSKSNSAK